MTLRRESTGPAGFEPATTSLTVKRSTTELQTIEEVREEKPTKANPLFLYSNVVPVQTNHDQKPGPTGTIGFEPTFSHRDRVGC